MRDVVRVDRADPRALLGVELMFAITRLGVTGVTYSVTPAGDRLITIDGINRKVIYRVRERWPHKLAYVIEWPD